jgi:ketosteroid isomerase-like protein
VINQQTPDSLAVVRRFYEAFSKRDDAALLALVADDAVWTAYGPPEVPFVGTWRGKSELVRYYSAVRNTLDVRKYEPREFVVDGGTVLVLGHVVAVAKPTGKTFESDFAHVYTVHGGLLTSYRNFLDTAALLRALRPE